MMSKLQFGFEAPREAAASRNDKPQTKTKDPGFAAALDRAQSRDEPKTGATARNREHEATEEAPPRDDEARSAEETTPEPRTDQPEAEATAEEASSPLSDLLMVPSERPRIPDTQAFAIAAAPAIGADIEGTMTVPSSLEVDVDLSMLEPTSRPPGSSAPPDPNLGDLTAAELASGFEMPWKDALRSESPPATVPTPATQLSPGVGAEAVPQTVPTSAPSSLTPEAAPLTEAHGTPRHLVSDAEPQVSAAEVVTRETTPAPHRMSLHDANIRDALNRSTRPSPTPAPEQQESEAMNADLTGTPTEALEGAEAADVADGSSRRADAPKVFATAPHEQLRERLSAARVQASHASGQLADEHALHRQEVATSAVNHMTLKHFAQADIEHPELGRIRVAARNVRGEIDVEMKARDANTVAVLQSTSGQLSSELRQASVDLRDLDVRQDDETASEAFEDQRGREAEERDPGRDRRPQASATDQQDETDEGTSNAGSSVRIVL